MESCQAAGNGRETAPAALRGIGRRTKKRAAKGCPFFTLIYGIKPRAWSITELPSQRAASGGVTVSVGADELRLADFLAFLGLIVMPLDGEEHADAEHDNFERNEYDREPIHHFKYFQAST